MTRTGQKEAERQMLVDRVSRVEDIHYILTYKRQHDTSYFVELKQYKRKPAK